MKATAIPVRSMGTLFPHYRLSAVRSSYTPTAYLSSVSHSHRKRPFKAICSNPLH